MEPLLEKISLTSRNSFAFKEDILPYISTPWHFHPEYELTLISESSGKRFVGDHVDFFYPGDLIFVGPNLPHFHRNSEIYYEGKQELVVRALVVHFLENFLGEQFFQSPEMIDIRQLMTNSERGLLIVGKTRQKIVHMIEGMVKAEGFDRILLLLKILHILSKSSDLIPLSSAAFYNVASSSSDMARMNIVYQYILDNYRNNLSLQDVADQVNMSPSAFCRFFKKRTGKTFSGLLNELRIGHACKLLMVSDYTASQICYESGYNNFSYFSRQFKEITQVTPMKYKKQFKGNHYSSLR